MSEISNVTVQRANDGITRHETHEGRDHLVVPVVMIKEGVLNKALLLREDFGKVVQAWNGRPVPILHPEENGEYISANSPKVLESRSIGQLFNAHVDGDKLKAEAWLDVQKADSKGFGPMIQTLESGEQGMEISTGYFSDKEPAVGEFNGRAYSYIDRNIVPDHLALLPGEIGACSWQDGCGVRANKSDDGVIRAAWNAIAQRLGLSTNCAGDCAGDCHCNGGQHMADEKTVAQRIDALKANKQITPEQLQMVQKMDEEQQKMMLGIVESMLNNKPAPEPEAEPESAAGDEDPNDPMRANKSQIDVNSADFKKLVANEVKDGMRRERVLDKLSANNANAFDDDTLGEMSTNALETYEKSIRPRDYAGQGGFAANSDAIDNDSAPLVLNRGVLSQPTTTTEQ